MARKKIACVMTEYRVPAHADVIIGKFINGASHALLGARLCLTLRRPVSGRPH